MLIVKAVKKFVYSALVLCLIASSTFAMKFQVKSIGPDPLGINGMHLHCKAQVIDKQRINSVKPGNFLFESWSSDNIKGKKMLVHLVGTSLVNTATTNGFMEIFDEKGKLIERGTYVHVADHPHTKIIGSKAVNG